MGFPQPDTGAVIEDVGIVGGFPTTTGDINFGPFFNNDAGQWTAETISGAYGSTLVINDDGVWSYSANNVNASIQALDTGDTPTEIFTATSTNGTSTITITINGADEAPCFVSGTLIDTPYELHQLKTCVQAIKSLPVTMGSNKFHGQDHATFSLGSDQNSMRCSLFAFPKTRLALAYLTVTYSFRPCTV